MVINQADAPSATRVSCQLPAQREFAEYAGMVECTFQNLDRACPPPSPRGGRGEGGGGREHMRFSPQRDVKNPARCFPARD